MATESNESPPRILLCLVADERVIECYPTAVRYLQIGLIDEPIDTVLVLPEDARALSLGYGPTRLITFRKSRWPLTAWARRDLIASVRRTIDSMPHAAPVIVNCLASSAAPLAVELAAALCAELVMTVTALDDLDDTTATCWLESTTAVITPSEAIRHRTAHIARAVRQVETIRFGVTAASMPAAFRERAHNPSLIFAGALTDDCGCKTLLQAVRRVLQSHPELRVFLIGKGPAEGSLRHLAGALDIEHQVIFTGRLLHWQSALEAADVFCLPHPHTVYREELLHALGAGLAIIAAEGSVYDCLIDEQNALLFPGGDDVQLSERICRLLDDHAFARTLGATAQAHARTEHSVGRMVADHVRLYGQLHARAGTLALPADR